MTDSPELWDGRWVVCRAPTVARPSEGAPPGEAAPEGGIVGLEHLPAAVRPSVTALVTQLSHPVDAQVALPLLAGGNALLTVRGDPAHVEVLVSGAGERPHPEAVEPLVTVLGDGRRTSLTDVAACAIDPDGATSAVTPALVEMVGSAPHRLRREGITSVVAEADRGRVLAVVRRTSDQADGVRLEPHDGGPDRWVTISGLDLEPDPTSIADPSPTDHGRLLVMAEIHPRFGDLARAAHRATAGFTQSAAGRARLDGDGLLTAANPALARMLVADDGTHADDPNADSACYGEADTDAIVGRPLASFVDPAHRDALSALLGALLAGDLAGFEQEVRLVAGRHSQTDDEAIPDGEGTSSAPSPDAPTGGAGHEEVIDLTDEGPSRLEGADVADVSPPRSSAGPLTPAAAPGAGAAAGAPSARWVRVQVDPVSVSSWGLEADVAVHDVSGRRRAESDDRDTVDALRSAFIHAPTPMAVIELDGRIREANSELRSLLDLGEVDSQPVCLADLAPAEDRQSIKAILTEITLGGRARVECRLRRRDGSDGVVELAVSAVTSLDHPSPFAIAQVNDITTQRDTEEKLLHQTLHDPLTGLANRLLLRERLERAVAARGASAFALMFIDLDHFKWTNDTHGHDAGDALLVEIARRLRDSVRGDDTVARLGGDEFVILAAGVSEETVARALAEKVRTAIAMPFAVADHVLTVTASVGVVLPGAEHSSPDALLRDADLAMYRAKSTGRDRHEVTIGTVGGARPPAVDALRLALDTDSLRLYHQPIIDLRTGRAVGTEALLRVTDPVAGTRPPGRLLHGITDAELMAELAGWVLDQVVEQMARWDEVGVGPLGAWINLSGVELETDSLTALVSRTLDRTGIDPTSLHLEVPEPALLLASASAIGRLRTLATLGVRIGIDDFGTGSTSLAHLRSLPLHFLKIDPSIGRRLREPGGGAVVEAVVAVGRALGLEVIAEEIEDRAQMEVLARVGCTHAQGNLFAAPAPAEALWQLDAALGDGRHR